MMDPVAAEGRATARERLTRVFRYLQALDELKHPVPRTLEEQPWLLPLRDFPAHPDVSFASAGAPDGVLLRVRKPSAPTPPALPHRLAGWVVPGWEAGSDEPEVRPTSHAEDGTQEAFEDDMARVEALVAWRGEWEAWVEGARGAQDVAALFEQLAALHGQLSREGERVELVVGDGVLSWRLPEGDVYLPVLLQRVQLSLDAAANTLTVAPTGRPPELHTALLRRLSGVDGRALARLSEELSHGGFHLLAREETRAFLARLAAEALPPGALFVGDEPPAEGASPPQLGCASVLVLRRRGGAFSGLLEGILQDLATREDVPAHLQRVVGVEPLDELVLDIPALEVMEAETEGVLLSKPANLEQVQLAQQLDRHHGVLVQGPPGTGKTHSIANLLGHLLAQGKRVLVTSHTSKALRVLRGHVDEALRPLCVSVLDSDAESRAQLEEAVTAIAERLARGDAAQTRGAAARLGERRTALLRELRSARAALLEAHLEEARELSAGGHTWTPAEAARWVAEHRDSHGWLPGPVTPGAALPLTPEEVRALYAAVPPSPEEAAELALALPAPEALLAPEALELLLSRQRALAEEDTASGEHLWRGAPEPEALPALRTLMRDVAREAEWLSRAPQWVLAAVEAGAAGGSHLIPWQSLAELVTRAARESLEARDGVLQHAPQLAADVPVDEQLDGLRQVVGHLKAGGTLSSLALLSHPYWRRLVRGCRVSGGEPETLAHFRALEAQARVVLARRELQGRWGRQMAALGAPGWEQLGPAPEDGAAQHLVTLKKALAWAHEVWRPLEARLSALGLTVDALLEAQPVRSVAQGGLPRVASALSAGLPPVLAARARACEREDVSRRLGEARRVLEGSALVSPRVGALLEALARGDVPAYARAHVALVPLLGRRAAVVARARTLDALQAVAPAWAEALREWRGGTRPPGDVALAWQWRLLSDALEKRAQVRTEALSARIEPLAAELRRVTSELIAQRAWAHRLERTTLAQQQALTGWLQLVKRMGAGTGLRVPRLQAAAARAMHACRDAVPVWVMPLSQVAESFDAGARFDVVIVDEASQSDVSALAALYLGRQVVIVGDHAQVSPSAVGQSVEATERLIDAHLSGIPNAELYDGRTSVYDLAHASFGGLLCLTEHFRCVPPLIAFSNALAYGGRIRPLRDAASATVGPALVPVRVEGAAEDKVNPVEALTVASLVVAALEQPEYAGKSMGVISLVGEAQALEVERLLREHLPAAVAEKARLVCGNPSQFQGDERDVVFLSLVDGPALGPLPRRETDDFRQRLNVAASRARDQLWVVHSLDARTDLKEGDLRRKFLEFCEDPSSAVHAEPVSLEAESPLEAEVLRRLTQVGYRVLPRFAVGHFHLDLVVEGGGKRLAVECDGDRVRSREELEEELARQGVLERLGWQFVRVRASTFFRDPDAALAPVLMRLEELGIPLHGAEVAAPAAEALRERVMARARTLYREWQAEGPHETRNRGRGASRKALSRAAESAAKPAAKSGAKPGAPAAVAEPVVAVPAAPAVVPAAPVVPVVPVVVAPAVMAPAMEAEPGVDDIFAAAEALAAGSSR
jgi:very-short-patch-repair endonuclease